MIEDIAEAAEVAEVAEVAEIREASKDGKSAAQSQEPAEHAHEHVHGPGCDHDHHAQEPVRRQAAKVGRNDPCSCGSGKKFKKCCG